ncbi:hypothetical protein HIM_04626 [Hirsutella minnesotensis 3608]|uniref:RING-type domain-containing protein n=1 Tax=Hirsutella minnesotensis 3608 TaxID=1043627 RepID=A0A0F7ZPV7_9HYPO|nr:hypothetical protein HIM_04626 [Hirsutella minnesotensis 3608]
MRQRRRRQRRRFRPQPPQSFGDVYARALGQRFYVLGRRRGGTDECPEETFELAGSTGNVYTVHVGRAPSCNSGAPELGGGGKRKPIEGDCPICFCELEAASPGSAVWCRAACGQNLHRECFDMWARTKKGQVTCPFCRSAWAEDPAMPSRVRMDRAAVSEGYANVADQLGMSGIRDTSSYSLWYGYH